MNLNLDLLAAIPGQVAILWLVLHIIASVLIGTQLAVAARMHPAGAIALSVFVPAIGPLILLIIALVRRTSPDAIDARAQSLLKQQGAVGSGIPTQSGGSVQMGGWTMQTGAAGADDARAAGNVSPAPSTGYQPFGGAPTGATQFGSAPASSTPFGAAPSSTAPFGAAPAGQQSGSQVVIPSLKGKVRLSVPIALGLIAVAVVVTGLLPWITLVIGPAYFGFHPLASQIIFIIVIQIILIVAALFLSLRKPSPYGAALVTIASTNLIYVTILALLIATPLAALAQQVNDSDLSLSDAAASFGIDATELQQATADGLSSQAISEQVEEQLDLSSLGLDTEGLSLESLGLPIQEDTTLEDLGVQLPEAIDPSALGVPLSPDMTLDDISELLPDGVGLDALVFDPDQLDVFDAVPSIQLNINVWIWVAFAVALGGLAWAVVETVLVMRGRRNYKSSK